MINDIHPIMLKVFMLNTHLCSKENFLIAAEGLKKQSEENIPYYLRQVTFGLKSNDQDAHEMRIYAMLLTYHDFNSNGKHSVTVRNEEPHYSVNSNYDEIVAFIAKQLPE